MGDKYAGIYKNQDYSNIKALYMDAVEDTVEEIVNMNKDYLYGGDKC